VHTKLKKLNEKKFEKKIKTALHRKQPSANMPAEGSKIQRKGAEISKHV